MAQVVGRKHYRLVPASQWHFVYNNTGVFSDVDCESPDFNRHSDFRKATVSRRHPLSQARVLFMPGRLVASRAGARRRH